MLTLHRLLLPLILIAVLSLSVRVGAIWHEAGIALAENAPAPAAPAKTDAAKPEAPATADPLKPAANQKFSPAEVEILQGLAKRRAELDQRSDELDQRELLLKAAEQRVQEKIDKLQQMQAQVDTALGKVEEQESERLKSLVHMYENMKPAEAAHIFETLDMPVLLELVTRMKDQKTGPILASMVTEKAKALTIALAEKKQMPDPKTN
jgi:flagellar motility protein MotE (MotC chaperone)